MIIDIGRLAGDGEQFVGTEPPAILEPLPEGVTASEPVCYDLHVERFGNDLLVRGVLSVAAQATCSRCACAFPQLVQENAFERVMELDAAAEYVDLTPEIRESIILGFPSYPVCRADCKGLCAHCGADLNAGPCACRPPPELRWGALDGLKL